MTALPGDPGGIPSPARQRRLPGGRSHEVKVKLSGQQKAQITIRAQAAGLSVPRLLAEAALTGGTPAASDWDELTAQLLTARQAAATLTRQISGLAGPHEPATCETAASRLASIAGELHDSLSRLAYQCLRSKPGSPLAEPSLHGPGQPHCEPGTGD